MTKMKTKFEDTLRPGDLIVTSMGSYEHYSIVSDRRCPLGKLMLLSARAETRTVREEPYDDVVRGKKTGHVRQQPELPTYVILANAPFTDRDVAVQLHDAELRDLCKLGLWAEADITSGGRSAVGNCDFSRGNKDDRQEPQPRCIPCRRFYRWPDRPFFHAGTEITWLTR